MISLMPDRVRLSARRWSATKPRRRLTLLLICLLAAVNTQVHAQMDEYSVKAGYLYNFSKYVTWPEGGFAAANTPFVICLLGEDPFEGRLDQAIAGKTSGNGRVLEVRRLNTPDRAAFRQCQVVFLGKSEKDRAAEIVETLKEAPIFTVADFEAFAEKGGVANLRLEGTRVKVDLNVNAANHANLKISARLQQVAHLVH
jgi:hypothetical protein